MGFIYCDSETIASVFSLFGTVFCSGFIITVFLHYIAYAVFGFLGLINIKS